jgi:CHAT domain-containing protein
MTATTGGVEDMKNVAAIFVLSALLLISLTSPSSGAALDKAAALQKSAISRIDAYIENFRVTGDMKNFLPELTKAQEELLESTKLFRSAGSDEAVALGLIKLGDVDRLNNRWDKALHYYQEAAVVARKSGSKIHEANALMGQARTETMGEKNLIASHFHMERAIQITSGLEDKTYLFNALCYKAEMLLDQQDPIAAFAALNRALAIRGKIDKKILFYGYYDRASIYLAIGCRCDRENTFEICSNALDRAKADYTQAAKLAEDTGLKGLAKLVSGEIEGVDLRKMLYQQKEQWAKSSEADMAKLSHPKKPSEVLVTEHFVTTPLPDDVIQIVDSALGKAKTPATPPEADKTSEAQQGSPNPAAPADPLKGQNLWLQGKALEAKQQPDQALQSYLAHVAKLESDRGRLYDPASKGTFFGDKMTYYYEAILQLLQRKRYSEAFDIMERSRSRGTSDIIQGANSSVGTIDHRAYSELMTLDMEISKLQKQLFIAATETGENAQEQTETMAKIGEKILPLEDQRRNLEERINPEGVQGRLPFKPATLEAMQGSMKKDRYEVLEYLVQDNAVILWHISADAIHVRNVFLTRAQLHEKVSTLLETMNRRGKKYDETTSGELFLFLIQPALQWITAEHLVIIPHDELNYIPFQVLQNPATHAFLGERFQISYAPSATVFEKLQQPVVAAGKVLIVSDKTIPESSREEQAIAKIYGDRAKVVTKESEAKALAGDYDIIHFSVHGVFDQAEPLLSYLTLGRDEHDNGKLLATEMFGLPLEKTQLVVLSACESGRVQSTSSNEIFGMERALLVAGAKALVLTLWRVDSVATALWMETFYREAQTQPLPEATRRALKAVKADPRYAHPYFWAPFIKIGR